MTQDWITLGFDQIIEQLQQQAVSQAARRQLAGTAPIMNEGLCLARMEQTTAARRVLAAQGIAAEPEPAGSAKHLFTHREWRMTGFLVRLPARLAGWTWAEPAELTGRYALPGAFRSFRSRVLAELAPSSK